MVITRFRGHVPETNQNECITSQTAEAVDLPQPRYQASNRARFNALNQNGDCQTLKKQSYFLKAIAIQGINLIQVSRDWNIC